MENYASHKRVEIRDWLAANPRIHVHFTPTSGSRLNLVWWFGIIQCQATSRGTFGSVKELDAKIRAFINRWSDRSHLPACTKAPEQILTNAKRQQTSNTGHSGGWTLLHGTPGARPPCHDAACLGCRRYRGCTEGGFR